ncbi:MAG TPA: lytic transglycosylase domain-containing protein [Streptosporangiaceae bacterium]
MLRRRIVRKPSKLTIGIAAAGIGVVAASATLAATWPAGATAGAATTADYLPLSHAANSANSGRFDRQLEAVKAGSAWQAELNAASAARAAAARRAAARKAAAARAAAKRAAELAAQQQAARQQAPARQAPVPPPRPVEPSGSAQQIAMAMLGSFGWSANQFSCLDPLWMRESGWSVTASNPDGAYGIPQAYPGSKMASAGPDWQTNAATQIRWGLGYIRGMYGSPCAAWSHEEATGWY